MDFPEEYVSCEPAHFGMFQMRTVSGPAALEENRGMINPYKKPFRKPEPGVIEEDETA